MRITVCTRQRYDDDATFSKRMALARKTCIPAVIAAAEELQELRLVSPHRTTELLDIRADELKLTWRWMAHERHSDTIVELLRLEGWKHLIEVVAGWGPAGDDMQVALDSDDRIEPKYLRTAAQYWRPGVVALRSWQPIKQRLKDGRLHRHRFRYRVKGRVSPFYVIYNPTPELHAYVASHGKLHELIEPIWMRDAGAIAVIHGENALMDLRAGDIRIEAPSRADYR